MQVKFKLGLVALLSSVGQWVYATPCEDVNFTNSILKQAHLTSPQGLLADCKVLPQQQDQALIVYQQGELDINEDSEHAQSYQLHLLTADIQQQKLLDHYIDPNSYTSDAMMLQDIRIDTAAYQLHPKLRAIGLRINFANSSSVNPYSYNILNLYDLKNHRKILNNLRVGLDQGENDGRCNADNHSRSSVLIVLNTQHQGMFDLRVNSKEQNESYRWVNDDCKQTGHIENKRSHVLIYNGQRYNIPRYLTEYEP